MESDISFTSDIIKEVSKNLNVHPRKVELVYKSLIKYVKHLVKNTTTTAIFFPYIGTFYVKIQFVTKCLTFKKYRNYNLENMKIRQDNLRKHMGELIKNKCNYTSRHFQMDCIKMKYYTSGYSIRRIEKMQNEKNYKG